MVKNRKLKIAQIAPLIERVPPKKYGGVERVVHGLTEELVKRGHDVTLFASGDSLTSAKLVSVYPRSLREARINNLYGLNDLTLLHIGSAYASQEKFDIIHDHNNQISLLAAHLAKTPTVMTLHYAFTLTNRRVFETLSNPYFVSISKDQARSAPRVKITDTVYNGITVNNLPFNKTHDRYLLFVGRMSMEKGVHIAIEVAEILDLPLIIAAKLDPAQPHDVHYFHEYIEPRLYNEHVTWIGEITEEQRNKLMSKALSLLHPVTWREPFGLAMVEAMACGCPVVAFNRGSIPELVVNGKTGFIVNDIEEMVAAVNNIEQIDRNECRRHAITNFNAQKMADGYEEIYRKILNHEYQ